MEWESQRGDDEDDDAFSGDALHDHVGEEETAEAARTSDDECSDAETTLSSADSDLGSDAGASEDDWASGSEDDLPDLVPAWQVISERSDEEEVSRLALCSV